MACKARRLHKQRMTYRAISAELERAGHVNERGKPFPHKSVRAMLYGWAWPRQRDICA